LPTRTSYRPRLQIKIKFAKLCQPGYYCYKGKDLHQDFVKRITKFMYYKEYLHKWEGFLITLL